MWGQRVSRVGGTGAWNASVKSYLSERREKLAKGQDRLSPTLALVCVVLLASWMGDASGGYFVGGWVPPTLVLAALTLLVSLIGFPTGMRARWGFLALGLFAAYAAWTFASLLWSRNPGDAWLGAGQTLLYLLVLWVAMALVTLGASRRWVLAVSALGPALVAVLTLLALVPRLGDLFDNDRLIGTVGYYNGEAAFLLLPLWAAVYLGGSRRVNPILRGVVLAGAVLCVDLAVLTQSRGAMVAVVVSLPVFFLLSGQRLRGLFALMPIVASLFVAFSGLNAVYLALAGGEAPVETLLGLVLPSVWLTAALTGLYGLAWGLIDGRLRLPTSVVRVAGGLALVCSAMIVVGGIYVLVERTGENPAAFAYQKWEAFKTDDASGQEQSRYLSASGSGRYALWQVAWRDFVAHPILGIGTQNYEATYYQLREKSLGFVRQPHMLLLEVLSERGIVGGVLFFGFLSACLAIGLRERLRKLGSEGKAQVGALVAAITYWFVHSSVEWFWQIPAVTLPAFVYLALLISPWERGETEPIGWPIRAIGVGGAVLAVAVVVPLYVADHYLAQSSKAPSPKEALVAVDLAQSFNPLAYQLPQREAELAVEAGDWDRAKDAYARAIRANPDHYAPYVFMAAFQERRGKPEDALLYYQKARALNPLDANLRRHTDLLQSSQSR